MPISRSPNSSCGALAEKWQFKENSTEKALIRNRESRAAIQYADLIDILKMLDITVGGGVMDVANELQFLVDLPAE